MKKTILTGLCLILRSLTAQEKADSEPTKTPEQIQAELDQAQKDFEIAKSMFIPWYTGPLITGAADNAKPGVYNFQPYLYFDTQYAQFNDNRKSVGIPNIFTIKPLFVFATGITNWLDITFIINGIFRWQSGHYAQGYGDTSVTFGLQIIHETPYLPSVRVTVAESFPTGRFERLSSRKGGIDATGSGAYATTVGLNVSKVFWQIPLHPIRWRFSGTYAIPDHDVGVKGFNAYGGGFGTDADVSIGQTLNLDTAIEVSITQKWVFALDAVFAYSLQTTFSGFAGVDSRGLPANLGAPSSDQLSFAPAIEYNMSAKSGLIAGVWFTVTGRNSANFATVVLSYTHTF